MTPQTCNLPSSARLQVFPVPPPLQGSVVVSKITKNAIYMADPTQLVLTPSS